eukprot:Seg1763.8 transcript_id=Seg1763.8/GoldUCD/mRNA.D3Y31 product="G-protein coupled receptor 84" protein_id=Seg1763.8/GoldUCD/D3Y31
MYAEILKVVLTPSRVHVVPLPNVQGSVEPDRKIIDKNENSENSQGDLAKANVKCNTSEGRLTHETGTVACLDRGKIDDTTTRQRQTLHRPSTIENIEGCDIIEGSLSNEKDKVVSLNLEQIVDKKVESRQSIHGDFGSDNFMECDVNKGRLSNEIDRDVSSRLERIQEEPEIDDKQMSYNNQPSKGMGIRKLQESKLIKGVFIILIFYTFQMVPFGFIDLLELNGTISVSEVVIRIAMILAYLNSAVNPPIYAASNKRYRVSFWGILSSCRLVGQVQNNTGGRVVVRGVQGSDADFVTGQPSGQP